MNNVERLLNIARAELGYHEKETNSQLDNPGANAGDENFQKFGRDLYKAGYYNGNKNGYDWCDQFVDWCFFQLCGSKEVAEKVQCQSGPYGAGCTWSARYYKAAGQLKYSDPQPGDQIFFRDYAHTGLVEEISNGWVYTIEGNSDNQVIRRKYLASDSKIDAYGRPRWEFVPEQSNPFVDVADDAWYAEAVNWAVKAGVTNGVDSTHFAPDASCNRASAITMLWRVYGSPEPASNYNPFMDVTSADFYFKPVLWALQKEITSGVDNLHFAPDAKCQRAQIVTFMWRADSEPEVGTRNTFSDVSSNDYFYKPVNWAVEKGITNGIGNNEFGAEEECTRAQVVTMLWRMVGSPRN